jgi:hypothetical protein
MGPKAAHSRHDDAVLQFNGANLDGGEQILSGHGDSPFSVLVSLRVIWQGWLEP